MSHFFWIKDSIPVDSRSHFSFTFHIPGILLLTARVVGLSRLLFRIDTLPVEKRNGKEEMR